MEINFDKEYLRQLYEEGKTTDKKHRFQPHVIVRYQLRVKALEQAGSIEELYPLRSLHYEVLKGDKAGISSIRVGNYIRQYPKFCGNKLLSFSERYLQI